MFNWKFINLIYYISSSFRPFFVFSWLILCHQFDDYLFLQCGISGYWCVSFFLYLILGWTEFPFIWIHCMCCGYSCRSSKISTTRNFAIFRSVRIKKLISYKTELFLWFSSCIFELDWHLSCVYQREAEFDESPSLHGSNGCSFPSPCHTYNGRKCGWHELALARDDVKIIWYLLFNSALAYFVNLTNFSVTKHTSTLTLQVRLDY